MPIPLSLAVGGAGVALVVSFVILATAWRTPRYDGGTTSSRAVGEWVLPKPFSSLILAPALAIALRVIGVALLLLAATAALFGRNDLTNPLFGMVYVWWWVGLVFASLLLGPVWKAISPVRTIHATLLTLSGGDRERGLYDFPARLGVWPAALGLYAFVWLELVYDNSSQLGDLRLWCAIYLAIMLVGGAVFGPAFYAKADPFEVYSSLAARLSPWHVRGAGTPDARIVLRSPLANLSTTPLVPGVWGVVAVLFGSTAFDSFADSSWWLRTVYGSSFSAATLNNLALAGFCVGVGILFAAGCVLTRPGTSVTRAELPDRFAHSLVPIIAGYIVAHYLTLFVDYGWQTLALVSDPLGKEWNLFGTAGLTPSFWFSYHPTLLATIKVAAVVVGHVAAAVSAHDRALTVFPPGRRVTSQLPLMVMMVAFTTGGLLLLFSA